jgi:hypothetical protein
VGWMQDAWRALEPRSAVAPRLAARGDAAATLRALPRRGALVAAALVLLSTAAALLLAGGDELPPPVAGRSAEPPVDGRGIEILDVRPDRVELRSGPVRLVLLEPPPPAPVAEPSGS